jgi:ABC-2 type transport system permease protein
MNWRGGWAMIRAQLFGYLSAKGFFWTLALGWMTGPLIYLFVWMTAAGSGTIGTYDRNGFAVYYLCVIVVNQLTYPTTHWSTAQMIHNGSISSALLRPLPLVYGAIGQELAVKLVCVPFVLAVAAVLGVCLGVDTGMGMDIGPEHIPLAAAAMLLAVGIRFLLAYCLSLVAFWTRQSGALLSVNDTLFYLLAGQVAPVALFPGALNQLASVLPYRYMLSFPVEVLMGTVSGQELIRGFAMQGVWLVLFSGVCFYINKQGVRRYSAVGG